MTDCLLVQRLPAGRRALPALLGCLILAGCDAAKDTEWFVEAGADSGVDFVHFNGMSGELYFVEMMGAGAALFDYDGDGRLDLYLVQGQMLPASADPATATQPVPGVPPLSDRLYRNITLPGGDPRFEDVTAAAGIDARGYGMGAATGDVDNDGDIDLYVTNFGSNQLWLNRGDGRFEAATARAGVDDDRWSVSATFLDYDNDGLLDLYVGNYVDYRLANNKPCRSTTSARDYCSPLVYQPQTDRLFRNLGNARFEDVSASSGILSAAGGALGVIAEDFNADGRTDIYVANDGVANLLWINNGAGRFTDEAQLSGVALNMDGNAEASMGVDAADFDGDGDSDLFMTHLSRESNTLYVNNGSTGFEDRTVTQGLANTSLSFTGFGTGWFDADNDGWLDLFSANGAVTRIQAQVAAGDPFPLRQTNQLFANDGTGRFTDVSDRAGRAFTRAEVSRGAAFGDLDNDGDVDIVVSNNAGPARLLLNQSPAGNRWIGVNLVLSDGVRHAVGARAALALPGHTMTRRADSGGSYASANDPRIVFGLGAQAGPVAIDVSWPDGRQERFANLDDGRYHQLVQGTGHARQ